MKLRYVVFCGLFIFTIFSSENSANEFVQPKKQCKRVSIDSLKRNNIEACSNVFESSASLVEDLGRFQKKLKQCVDEVLKEETRTYHEQKEQHLEQVINLLHQMENLLATCQNCLHD